MAALRPRVRNSNKPGVGPAPIAAGNDDKLLQAIAKWIPVEVITVYNLVMAAIPEKFAWFRLWFTVGLIPITFFWIAFATEENKRIAWRQAMLAPFAFACWTTAMQSAMLKVVFPGPGGWEDWMGSVALGVGTLLLPILNGVLRRLGVPQD